ncbi:MAG: phosphotransferase family protein [Caldilineaceae bacterium]
MPTDFITQRHAVYQTPQALIFDLIQQVIGDEPISLEKLVRGYDNEVYAVQTRQEHDYIVRLRQHGGAGYAEEQWAIQRSRAVGVPAPEICYVGLLTVGDQHKPVMVQRRVPGRPLAEVYATLLPKERGHIFRQVGALLSKLHTISVGGFYKLNPGDIWDFPDWESIDQANRQDRTAERPQLLTAGLREEEIDAIFAITLADNPPIDRQPVLCHGDLGPDHLFVDNELNLTGVIDFGEFQGGLPVVDFARLSLDCSPEELAWVQEGYPNKALLADNFAQHLRQIRLNFLSGYLAHCVRIADHEEVAIVVATIRDMIHHDQP